MNSLLVFFALLLAVAQSAFVHGPRGASRATQQQHLLEETATTLLVPRRPSTALYAEAKKTKKAKKSKTKKATKKASKAAAAAKPESFKKGDFVAAVSEKTGMNKKESEEALQAVLDVVREEVGAGKRVSLPGFGTFTLKDRSARKGRNPQTGEELDIPASKSPGFSAAKAWKDEVNGRV